MNKNSIAKAAITLAQSAYSAAAAAKNLHDLDPEATNATLQAYRLCLVAKEACECAALGLANDDELRIQLQLAIAEADMRTAMLKPLTVGTSEEMDEE